MVIYVYTFLTILLQYTTVLLLRVNLPHPVGNFNIDRGRLGRQFFNRITNEPGMLEISDGYS